LQAQRCLLVVTALLPGRQPQPARPARCSHGRCTACAARSSSSCSSCLALQTLLELSAAPAAGQLAIPAIALAMSQQLVVELLQRWCPAHLPCQCTAKAV
jgi:hypothetical protein